MIPKIIHYCWLSGEPFPDLIKVCVNSWHRVLYDYKFVLWDVNQIDVNSNLWLKQAYEKKKYAFAADYIRFYALYNYGGIYLDADVEVVRTFNPLLENEYFLGEEAGGDIEAAVIGVEKGAGWIKSCLDYYENRPFIKADGTLDTKPVPLLLNRVIKEKEFEIRPYYFFSPKDYNIGKMDIYDNTFCIHHFDGKWLNKRGVYTFKRYIHRIVYSLLGRRGHNKLVRILRKFK